MASRNGSERGAVVAQSACPLFGVSVSVSTAATIFPLPPFSVDNGPNGQPIVADAGQLYILQCTQNMNVHLQGAGTVSASGTVTYTAPSGAQTVSILGYTLSFTSSGVANTDAATVASLVNSDALLSKFFVGTSSTNVATITYKVPGAGGNSFTFTGSGTGAAFSGSGKLTSGVGPTANASATSAYFVTANQPFFVYRLQNHSQVDVVAAAAGTLNIFFGV